MERSHVPERFRNRKVKRKPGLYSKAVHVGFVVDKVALGQICLRVVSLSFHQCSTDTTFIYRQPCRVRVIFVEEEEED
jgi:hypothetical protein